MPRRRVYADGGVHVSDKPERPSPARILICEDEGIIAEDMAGTLRGFGYEVVGVVSSGEEAIQAAEQTRPDLILMDVKLRGEIHGITACQRIRASQDVPVIYITAYDERDTLERAKLTEPYGFLVKPVGIPELRSTVEIALYKNKMEKRLKRSEERYRELVETVSDGIVQIDASGTVTFANPAYCRMLGISMGQMVGKSILDFQATESAREEIRAYLAHVVSMRPTPVPWFGTHQRSNGEQIVVQSDWSYRRDDRGNVTGFIAVVKDITERRKSDNRIRASLKEKEALLREIHHRVKNNLAVVSSLLGLQSRHAKDEYHRGMFLDSRDRINSMALAHEKLYRAENLSAINSRDYLSSLVRHLMAALGCVGTNVELQLEVAEVELDLQTGITLALIASELVSNCLKHAFPDGRAGKIFFTLKETGHASLELSVVDDGVGLSENIESEKPNTLGLDLVRIFSRQLNGHLEFRRNGGTEVVLRFSRRL
jgi:PAS domain S-box-containing protein